MEISLKYQQQQRKYWIKQQTGLHTHNNNKEQQEKLLCSIE